MTIEQSSALFNVLGIGLVLLVSSLIRRKYKSPFFTSWTLGYAASFVILVVDWVRTFSPDQPLLSLLLAAAASTAAWFYFQTAQILQERPVSARWGWLLPVGVVLLGLAVMARGGGPMAAVVPASLIYSFSGIWLGSNLLKRSARAVAGRHWVGWPMIVLALWSYTYPIFQGKSYFWVGYFVSGLLQILVGLGMALFLLEYVATQLERQNVQLKQLDEMKMNFLTTVSHELRTPLTCIVGYLGLLRNGLTQGGSLDPEICLDGMSRSSAQLSELVESLLDSVQIQRGQLKVERTSSDFAAIVADALAPLRPLADQKVLRLETALPEDLPRVYADPRRTGQVLTNLVGNAIKFTPKNGLIRLSAVVRDERLIVDVRDTGIGIPAAKLGEIFQPFVQADNSLTRQHGGTGLGLSIAKSLIEAMEGTISVESVEGQGSTFRFTLPLDPAVTAWGSVPA